MFFKFFYFKRCKAACAFSVDTINRFDIIIFVIHAYIKTNSNAVPAGRPKPI